MRNLLILMYILISAAYPGFYGHYFPTHHALGNSAIAAAAAAAQSFFGNSGSGGVSMGGGTMSGLLGNGPTPKRKRRHRYETQIFHSNVKLFDTLPNDKNCDYSAHIGL